MNSHGHHESSNAPPDTHRETPTSSREPHTFAAPVEAPILQPPVNVICNSDIRLSPAGAYQWLFFATSGARMRLPQHRRPLFPYFNVESPRDGPRYICSAVQNVCNFRPAIGAYRQSRDRAFPLVLYTRMMDRKQDT